jgi:hypothetical protein
VSSNDGENGLYAASQTLGRISSWNFSEALRRRRRSRTDFASPFRVTSGAEGDFSYGAKCFVAVIAAVIATMVVVVYLGNVRWKEKTAAIRSGLDRARVEADVAVPRAAAELPGPVRRYLDAVLPEGRRTSSG